MNRRQRHLAAAGAIERSGQDRYAVVEGAFSAYDSFAMIRFLFRLFGLLCLALAFILLVYDGTKSIADQRWFFTKVSDVWTTVHEPSLTQLQPTMERLSQGLWDHVLIPFLNAPSWLVLAVVGAILLVVGRKRRPLIGYGRD
jgi:hypothetical protein